MWQSQLNARYNEHDRLVHSRQFPSRPAVSTLDFVFHCRTPVAPLSRSTPEQGLTGSIQQHEGRTFLELERFDRHGLHGRSPVCSLFSLNAALLGDSSTDWSRLAARLHMDNRLSAQTLEQVRRIGWFGKLIGNTDMHLGNLSFRPGPELTLAPGYDMLPMFYAPLAGGEVPEREFGVQPPLPLPPQKTDWHLACEAALQFWRQAEQDARISSDFRQRCGANARKIEGWRGLV